MTRSAAQIPDTGDPEDLTRALLASLGLPDHASREEIELTREQLTTYLASAPPELGPWAAQQSAVAQAAFTLLSGPSPADPSGSDAHLAEEGATDPDPDDDDVPQQRSDRPRSPGAVPAGRASGSPWAKVAVALVAAALVVGIYFMGDRTSTADPTASAPVGATATPVDQARVTQLMEKLSDSPDNVATMRTLAEMYSAADDWPSAAVWRQKIVDLTPDDVDARLVLGVAYFNSSNLEDAESEWLKVVELDPMQAEAFYDLGFLYLSKTPSDTQQATAMWTKVVEIDPASDLAKVVKGHLAALASPSPSASGR
ncbi:MAG TPA: hypothetical protein VLR88_06355 [Propionibacteriaceae bacterium]|nr:hypothetical protein [Propionibacteriaceae bacterium]